MRINAIVGVLTVVCACSSSSTKVAGSDGGDGGGSAAEDAPADAPQCSTTKPQLNNAGSCTQAGIAPQDAGDAGAVPVWCIEYTGSGLVPSGTAMACKTMQGAFSTSACTAVNAAATVVGYCLRSCGTPQEFAQYYYMGMGVGVADAQSQCESLMGDVWVAQ